MGSDIVIRAEGLGKNYILGGHERERYTALRDVFARGVKSAWRRTTDIARGGAEAEPRVNPREEFRALKEVNFDVERGEVLGIIGRNGAGKSTLLKILSRITEPSQGRVTIKGRVASLLEVGTGFHPELSGRENIYLNGAILGMTRSEIRKKFDEIVDFAGVARFLDTPVKRYSSGMYVRLAFAVAAHLESEILVVDEVLAVGDAEFQRKCLAKMGDAAMHDRTVLFVSHNMGAVQKLCSRSILLTSGSIIEDGQPSQVIGAYLDKRGSGETKNGSAMIVVREGLALEGISFCEGIPRTGDSLDLVCRLHAEDSCEIHECALLVFSLQGERIGIVDTRSSGVLPVRVQSGVISVKIRISSLPLVEGEYALAIYLVTDSFRGTIYDAGELRVSPPSSTERSSLYPASVQGFVVFDAETSVATSVS